MLTKEIFIQAALSYLHVPYVYGGNSSLKGLDCSGFAQEILRLVGLDPKGDQTAQGLFDYFLFNGISAKPSCGALCFYGPSPKEIQHVAIMLSEFFLIEAGGGDSNTQTVTQAQEQDAKVRIRPYSYRKTPIVILPDGLPW